MDVSERRYVMLVSAHGLIRGHNLELGRDADTGGQTKYVVELARALAQHPSIRRVDLVTRRVLDRSIDGDYASGEELLETVERPDGSTCISQIVRIPCGPDRYLAKEQLWPYLDEFVDRVVERLRSSGEAPDLIHGHYADAGYVAARLGGILDVPMVFTGHSLGRVKKIRLLEAGQSEKSIERRYKITRRVDAEELALGSSTFVVASTQQEVDEQYGLYEYVDRSRMIVIPPGVDLDRFSPPPKTHIPSPIEQQVNRFLRVPEKPVILALARADPRKNLPRLVEAYGQREGLRDLANLCIIAGNRDDIDDLDSGARETWKTLLSLIDTLDLYGHVAYPKHHRSDDVPDLYRMAARRKGIFINPALTEPFGLTLLEAAASGLPMLATHDGGPKDILKRCKNGLLIDPLDLEAMGEAMESALVDRKRWQGWRNAGLRGVVKHYSWKAHVDEYMRAAKVVLRPGKKPPRRARPRGRLVTADRLIIVDLDDTLIGKREAARELMRRVRAAGSKVAFGIATGRGIDSTREVLASYNIEAPDIWITSAGSTIYYGRGTLIDKGYQLHINRNWKPRKLMEICEAYGGLELQGPDGQDVYKVSYFVKDPQTFDVRALRSIIRKARLPVQVTYSHEHYLDLLPSRASKGLAIRYIALRFGLSTDMILTAGDSGNDESMLSGNTLGVVVGNHAPELETLRGRSRVYFAEGSHARGILEGVDYYNFLSDLG